MSTALAKTNGQGGALAGITDAMSVETVCQHLARSGYFKDASDVSKAVVKVLYGREIGVGPVTAMMGIHIIEGKPAPSSNLLAARVKASTRYDYRVLAHTPERCEIAFFERGQEIGRIEWTIEMARAAGVAGKPVWKAYARAMLLARCISEGVRAYCPDVFGGAAVYVAEELGAEVDREGNPVQVDTRTGEILERQSAPKRAQRGSVWVAGEGAESAGDRRAAEEPIDVAARVSAAAETAPSYAAATGLPSAPAADPDAEVKRLKGRLLDEVERVTGLQRADKAAFTAYVERALGHAFEWKHLDAADYRDLLAEVERAEQMRRRFFALWRDLGMPTAAELGSEDALADAQRRFLAEQLGREVTSRKQIAAPEWRTVLAAMAPEHAPEAADQPHVDPFATE